MIQERRGASVGGAVVASAASVRAVGVEHSYGEVHALRGVSLDVRAGEFLTLLGPSGSGKTTLLNVIAGFQRPSSGDVQLDGVSIVEKPAFARGFGMVFQSYALFPHMSVADNVAYPLRMRGVDARSRHELVGQYLRLVELDGFAERYPGQLSGGQQQRVALARALVFSPPVLLMDEPLGALDRRLRQALQFAIKRLHQELSATIVYVTHDQEEALAMSDRIVVMRDGVIEQVDVPKRIYDEPQTAFVASFLGETNLLQCDVLERRAGATRFRHVESGQEFELPLTTGEPHVLLSIRPESLRLNDPASRALFSGRTVTVSFMGDAWRCEIEVGNQPLIVRQPVHLAPAELGADAMVGVLDEGVRLMPDAARGSAASEPT